MRPQKRVAWPLVVAAAGMVVAGVVAGFDAMRDSPSAPDVEGRREGSTSLGRAASPLVIDDVLAAYVMEYRVTDTTGSDRSVEMAVSRPFDSRSVERGSDGFERVDETSLGRTASASTRTDRPRVFAVPPRSPDHRPGAVVNDALAAGLVERRERRRVDGRKCDVYRSSGTFERFRQIDSRAYTDTCIDGRGVVLEDWQVEAGEPVRHRIATRVHDDMKTDRARGAAASRLPADPTGAGAGSVRAVAPDSAPEGVPFFVLPTPPEGFEHLGRFAVVPAQPALGDPTRTQDAVIAGTADVFVRGGDFVVVDQGGTLGRVAPFEPDPDAVPVDLGAGLGAGEGLLGWAGAEVRVARDGGRYVRVYGSATLDALAAAARALVPTEGGRGLVYL